VVAGNSKRKMNLRTTGPPCLGAVFVFGPLPSFFQTSSLAIRRLWKPNLGGPCPSRVMLSFIRTQIQDGAIRGN